MILQFYPEAKNVEIIYPPVNVSEWESNYDERKDEITTMGRFNQDKRHLEQIEIAEKLPAFNFNIIGFVGDKTSRICFMKCKNLVEEKKLRNVKLLPNLSREEVHKRLCHSKFFMHNLRNEPFGISTVEAIAAGCIPIVHNSGGQKEIVTYDELRFEDKSDAVKKVQCISEQNQKIYQKKLINNIKKFDKNQFALRFNEILNRVMNT
jgi:glycosyltransferase involved in cell wall biosynthesis